MSARDELLAIFYRDRVKAHEVIFAHRHPHESPPFHREMILDWHSPHGRVLDLVFRGGAKSTIAEEAVSLMAGFREFKNAMFVGASKDRAMERLHAVRHEVEMNDTYRKVFGDLVGPVWSDDELVFSNGRRIIALGRGQSLRGTKWEEIRPDLMFCDDLEDRDEAWNADRRAKTYAWFIRDLVPAGDVDLRVRVAATPLDPQALPMRLQKRKKIDGTPEWIVHTYPIYYLDPETGMPVSTWPARWTIESIMELEESYRTAGDMAAFNSEFMCLAESPETKLFKPEMIRVEPRVRTWEPCYSMTDPARTKNKRSATTGFARWSWIGRKLIIWEGWGKRLMPDEIIKNLFDDYAAAAPVIQGFEEDGLNEWALQPIRTMQLDKGIILPLKALKAPRGKIDFIGGLQQWFKAGEVEFAKPLDSLRDQLLGFPTGDIDAPNALAYAPRMRPGAPIYDGFKGTHVETDLTPFEARPVWLCLNATRHLVTAVAVQISDGLVRVFGDYVREGDPAAELDGLVAEAQIDLAREVRLTAGPVHFSVHHNVGLVAAASRIPRRVETGIASENGRAWLINALERDRRGVPQILVSDKAKWTLNGFSGGYARALRPQGVLADEAEEGVYRTLMEGLESFVGLLDLGMDTGGGRARLNAINAQGRAYRSIDPRQAIHETASKDKW